MGVYNRDYMRAGGGGGRGMQIRPPRQWSVVTWLIVINLVVFLVQHIFLQPNVGQGGEKHWGALGNEAITGWKVHTFVTSIFIHGHLLHLLFNMFGLFIFGRILLNLIGSKQFLLLYFVAGILSGMVSLGVHWGDNSYSVGASGSVIAIVIATCFSMPELGGRLLFPPIEVKFKHIAWFIIGMEILRLVMMLVSGRTSFTDTNTNIGVVAHLGGIAVGWAYIKFFRKSAGFQDSFGFGAQSSPAPRRKKKSKPKKERKPKKPKAFVSKDVDAILDKISSEGMQSLTPEERKILDQRSEELSDRLGK